MKRIHRLFLTVPIVAMLTAVVPTTQAARPQAASHAAITLNIATDNNPQRIDMENLTPQFEKQYGIKVKYVTLPENTLREKVTSDVATGGGQFDLATVGTFEVPNWAKQGWNLGTISSVHINVEVGGGSGTIQFPVANVTTTSK